MRKTTVVNIYRDKYDVYCGRAGNGQSGILGNPFHSKKFNITRSESIRLFKDYFYKRLHTDPEFKAYVESCRGKILGCFCKPKSCHADIIAEYLNDRQVRI